MEKHHLTPDNFDREGGVRHILRYEHSFGHDDLERAKEVVLKGIEHIENKTKTTSGMGAHHFDIAMKYFKEKPEGKVESKKIPEHKRPHDEPALKRHYGITEPEQEAA